VIDTAAAGVLQERWNDEHPVEYEFRRSWLSLRRCGIPAANLEIVEAAETRLGVVVIGHGQGSTGRVSCIAREVPSEVGAWRPTPNLAARFTTSMRSLSGSHVGQHSAHREGTSQT
jgi:hypothetical protein